MPHIEQPSGRGAPTASGFAAPRLLVLILGLMPIHAVSPAGEIPEAPAQTEVPVYSERSAAEDPTLWLDEVRAQRRAWEERRDAARSAFEARRRANNPWGAAQQEAWDAEAQRRRTARIERMDQERDLFRSLGPGQPPFLWPGAAPFAAEPGRGPESPPGAPPEEPLFAPPGWDNHWYFRGF
ncbi:MAG: hypothetical protein LJE61_04985 [Thiocapsa sp.]|jgi:hypothetical protein|nr:hypothetical protein [Thiocapsa sp.]MCG6897814.1 hypothetical protein [Thiocapsa sp.]MCG6984548.1 hypothetical protein [Thiocapsa sp.]